MQPNQNPLGARISAGSLDVGLRKCAHLASQRNHGGSEPRRFRHRQRSESGHIARVVVGVDQVRVDGECRLDVPVPHQLRDVDGPDARREAQARVRVAQRVERLVR